MITERQLDTTGPELSSYCLYSFAPTNLFKPLLSLPPHPLSAESRLSVLLLPFDEDFEPLDDLVDLVLVLFDFAEVTELHQVWGVGLCVGFLVAEFHVGRVG